MKKIYLLLADGTKEFLGFAASLYEYLLDFEKRIIVPFHGNINYATVKNIYHPVHDQYVTYTSV